MKIFIYIIIGFCAQLIDGTLGMAYGVSCRTFLKVFAKVPSSAISAIVHYAEIPTSFTSMIFHIKYKNVDKKMLINLIIPGIIGSVIGAYIITFNFNFIEIIVDVYLIIIGIIIFSKGFQKVKKSRVHNSKYYISLLGLVGAFFDASGGGGWGPIVTGSLISNSDKPKEIIGTVNSSEFFVTLSSSITFILLIANIEKYIPIIIGLIIGGIIASPLAVKICQKLKDKKLYFMIGALLVILNIYNIILIIT